MTRWTVVVVAAIVGVLLCQGCGRLIDEGVEKGLGPTAKTLPMEPKWPANDPNFLAQYKNFELGSLKSNFPDTPQAFMDYFPTKLQDQLLGKSLPVGKGGKTLAIDVTILAYQPVSSYSKALGPTEEVVADVILKDKESGKVVGHAICIGRTYQSVGLGVKWKAWGLSRAIVNKWIDKYYPKEGRVETEETKVPSEQK
jgi:hypothetical protein